MLPQDELKYKTPMGDIGSDDLLASARKSAMSKFMKAVKSEDASQALDAFEDLMELCEMD